MSCMLMKRVFYEYGAITAILGSRSWVKGMTCTDLKVLRSLLLIQLDISQRTLSLITCLLAQISMHYIHHYPYIYLDFKVLYPLSSILLHRSQSILYYIIHLLAHKSKQPILHHLSRCTDIKALHFYPFIYLHRS